MYLKKGGKILKKALCLLPVLLILPFLLTYDSLTYFITRPTCLNCGSLLDFLKNASLTVFLLGGTIGYKLNKDKHA